MRISLSNKTFSYKTEKFREGDLTKILFNTFKVFINSLNSDNQSIEILIGSFTGEEDNLININKLESIKILDGTYYLTEIYDSLNESHTLEINYIGGDIIVYVASTKQTKKAIWCQWPFENPHFWPRKVGN